MILLACSVNVYAQNNNRFQINIEDPNNQLDVVTASNLRASFNLQYPAYAHADGYRTKRNVTLQIANNETETIKAKAGEIKVNSDWVKGKSLNKVNKELWNALTSNWSSFSKDKRKGYSLTFVSKDPNLDPVLRKKLIDTYFEVYPTLVKTFNDKSPKDVLFVVDTAYKAVAEASGNRILFSAGYMKAHPTDIDVVTHEGMHVVQGYGYGSGPVWLTEGIADYVRYKYGVDNVGSKWSLPAFKDTHSYKNSYRITARFFVWLEQNVKSGLIATLDQQLRVHQYSEQSWVNLTGKTLDQLWDDYAKNPNQIQLQYSDKKSKS
ncbi:MAG: basic secretory protein-like protein [Pedobacter sp.]|uniref:basic secretory protein-like protein n=1 Tax=Pedobacter sp. TaxID=1411316 RepID=UPI0028089B88|nr:basic secretory protein-like protein [Pedobacter sp.]MDQ8004777.1 basic secretory protein-like protein [Pedobacter sp.]